MNVLMSLFSRTTGLFVLVFGCFSVGCNNGGVKRNKSHADIPEVNIKAGKQLAAKYCQSCHLLPDPGWVSAASWQKGILPNMGPRLGIFEFGGKKYPSMRYDLMLSRDFYPANPIISNTEWQQIIDYYTAAAPDSVSTDQHRTKKISMKLNQFSVHAPAQAAHNKTATSFVKINPLNAEFPIVVADAISNRLYLYNKTLRPSDSVDTRSPVVDVEKSVDGWITCNIGVLNPNNGRAGNAALLQMNAGDPMLIDFQKTLVDLRRPVMVKPADLNNDGREDYLVCEFGYMEGALTLYENMGDTKYVPHVLRPLPGAIAACINDFNHDGLPDIWVLFAQGEEGIFLYTNKGNGNFDEKEILRFPPINGSSYFELDDFNNDGFPDILYTCGDNADYSTELKPYHGVYIYLNDGHNNFTKNWFYPINGCYKAVARDFDKDGDLDIATIAHFADFQKQPEEGFVYFENKGGFDFLPFSSKELFCGRWLTMDVGDLNKDGYDDIIIGNFSIAPSFITPKVDWKKGPPFLVLTNTGNKTKK
jgi:hypothetical protein